MTESQQPSAEPSPLQRRRGRPLGSKNIKKPAAAVPDSTLPPAATAAPAATGTPIAQLPKRRAIGFRTGTFSAAETAPKLPPPEPPAPSGQPARPAARPAAPSGQPARPYFNGNPNGSYGGNWGKGQRQQKSDWGNRWKDKSGNRRRPDKDDWHNDTETDDEAYLAADYGDRDKINLLELQAMNRDALVAQALKLNLEGAEQMNRHDLLFEMVRSACRERNAVLCGGGVLEILPDGNGMLRSPFYNYLQCPEDVLVNGQLIRRWGMRTGDTVVGQLQPPRERDRWFKMMHIDSINGESPELRHKIVPFENLIPYFPKDRIILEHDPEELSSRVIDLVTPLGRGQRGLIVAAPRTGKTVIMQKIANSITARYDDIELIVLLIDERPEEVTDMKRMVKGEVVSSTFDEPPDHHVQVAEMVIEKAKRMVEYGRHVVILLDSITRLARAYNTVEPHSGRILTGGVDANALSKPKRFFGAARNIEGGGSLTILATALIDTGSRMDEVIFEEFKGTGNMELHLDRHLVDKRVYPAICIEKSGTRREDLLMAPDELKLVWSLRKMILELAPQDAMEHLLNNLKKKKDNYSFLKCLEGMIDENSKSI